MGGAGAGTELAVATVNLTGDVSGVVVCGLWYVDGAGAGTRVIVKLATHSLASSGNRTLWDGVRLSLDLHGEGVESLV